MKDSGQDWIGCIPAKWSVSRIFSLYNIRNEKVSDKDYAPLSVTMKGIVPQLESAAKTDNGDNRKLVIAGDFVINSRSDRRGSCGISAYDGSVSLINTVLTPLGEMNPGYYNWLFHTVAFADEFYKWGHGIVDDLWTTRWQDMKRIIVPVPPLEEQSKISAFLDDQCSQIDAIIAGAKASIEEYKRWRRSIIQEAVSKGVTVSPNMKTANLDWIAEIPYSWDAKKIKFFGEQSTIHAESNIGYIGLENVESGTGNYIKSGDDDHAVEGVALKITPNDVIFGKLRPYLAKCLLVEESGCCSTEFIVIHATNCSPRYLKYIMLSPKFVDIVNMSTYGAKMPRANWSFIGSIKAPFPSITEQELIADWLDKKCTQMDSLISEKKDLIDELEAYKRSLIYETVTGKRKVV